MWLCKPGTFFKTIQEMLPNDSRTIPQTNSFEVYIKDYSLSINCGMQIDKINKNCFSLYKEMLKEHLSFLVYSHSDVLPLREGIQEALKIGTLTPSLRWRL